MAECSLVLHLHYFCLCVCVCVLAPVDLFACLPIVIKFGTPFPGQTSRSKFKSALDRKISKKL